MLNYQKIPEYYPTMFMDGFTPEEIWYAKRKQILQEIEERENPDDPENIRITSEVKIK